MNENEQNLLEIIVNSGEAKSLSFEAIRAAKEGRFEDADLKMKEAKAVQLKAHHAQTQLLVQEANGEKAEFSILLVHAQDHLMTSLLLKDIIGTLIDVYRK